MIDKGSEPAYPQPATPAGYRAQWASGTGGLTKREAFALSAQAAIIGGEVAKDITAACVDKGNDEEFWRVVAEIAIEHADALLAALEPDEAQEVDKK